MVDPYPIYGKLYETDESTVISGATVKLRNENTNEVLSVTTNANGEFVHNCGNFTKGWTDQDYITLYVIYIQYSKYVTLRIDVTNYPDGREQDLILEAVTEGILRYFTVQEFFDTFGLCSYEENNESGIKIKAVILVGRGIEANIDQMTHRKWDNNQGNYYTATQEYHNSESNRSGWPENIDRVQPNSANIFFTDFTPIHTLTTFQVNLADQSAIENWTTLTEDNNEITVKKSIGRIEIVDSSKYPAPGKDQVRITYTYGEDSVPEDIKRLAILMTGRAFASRRIQRLNINATEIEGLSSASSNLVIDDKEIDTILRNRSFFKISQI